MIPEERLTAYALDEVHGAERAEIEQHLAANPEAARAVETTRALAGLLTAELAREAVPPANPSTLAAVSKKPSRVPQWAALAASVLILAGITGTAMYVTDTNPLVLAQREAPASAARATVSQPLDGLDSDLKAAVEVAREDDVAVDSRVNAQPPISYSKMPAQPDPTRTVTVTKSTTVTPTGGVSPGLVPSSAAPAPPTIHSPTPADPLHLDPEVSLKAARRGEAKPGEKTEGANPIDVPSLAGLGDESRGKDLGSFRRGVGGTNGMSYDRFPALEENAFVKVEGQAALSTFGVDVDTASYSIVRKFLSLNQMPPPGAVRLEEIVNYFPYRDVPPTGDDPFAVTVEVAECPWQPKNRLARIGLKAKPIDFGKRPASNLVFLIDVSGSMNEPKKLPLVKASMKMLVEQLSENDRVAMVVYAGASGQVLESTSAASKPKILDALDRLEAGGSTNGAGGLKQAYEVAVANFIQGGTNRVILCTDGDWNVGTTSTDELIKLVEEKRKSNVFLSVLGFGMGNLRDEMMVNLAGKGNGNYAYIDTLKEARKALVEQLGGTLVTVAKDVKIQVEFNPAKVGSYRLLGYEKRKLAAEDFKNDAKDAGEMGAGHVVTALYELTPAGTDAPGAGKVDELRYQGKAEAKNNTNEAFVVKLRHKAPNSDVSTERQVPIQDSTKKYGEVSEDFRFAAAAASYAMLLRDSQYKGIATYAMVKELAEAAKGWDPGGYRAEFIKLVDAAKKISGKP